MPVSTDHRQHDSTGRANRTYCRLWCTTDRPNGAQNAGPRRRIDAEASVQGRSGGRASVNANLWESFAIAG